MRIAQVSTLSSAVRQDAGGSVEAWLWLLTRELTRLGHQVTVFGAGGSEIDGEFVATLPGPYGAEGSLSDWHVGEWVNLCRAVEAASRFDVLHTHAYLWGTLLEPVCRPPMLHTLHIVPDEDAARLWSLRPQVRVTALSKHQWSAFPALHPAAIIPHGVDVSQFTFRAQPEDYVCYLGRFTSGKGPCQAIAAARHLGLRLLMAGPPNAYFREKVQPLIDGKTVEYLGYIRGAERDKLLGGARALLYPIQYPESFGLVLIEAMLCGTPVAAMRLGAVPEIVTEAVTGCCANSLDDFPRAVARSLSLDRQQIRKDTEQRFSAEVMAQAYARLYAEVAQKSNL